MRTDDFIKVLAADRVTTPVSLNRLFGLFLIPSLAFALLLYASKLGLRPHFFEMLGEDPRVLFKIGLMLLLISLLAPLVLRIARPGIRCGRALRTLWLVPGLLILGDLAELMTVPQTDWMARLIGHNALFCLTCIPLLAAAPLVAILMALREGAPTNPALAGALGGLLAGAFGAMLYATHCPDDSPLFVAVWYSIAIGFITGLGALAGSRWLSW
jgi:hypothetical protein